MKKLKTISSSLLLAAIFLTSTFSTAAYHNIPYLYVGNSSPETLFARPGETKVEMMNIYFKSGDNLRVNSIKFDLMDPDYSLAGNLYLYNDKGYLVSVSEYDRSTASVNFPLEYAVAENSPTHLVLKADLNSYATNYVQVSLKDSNSITAKTTDNQEVKIRLRGPMYGQYIYIRPIVLGKYFEYTKLK